MFGRVVLYRNLGNNNSMTCIPGFIWGVVVKEAYRWQAAGKSSTFQERRWKRVSCGECGVKISESSLRQHISSIQRRSLAQNRELETRGGKRDAYRFSFPRVQTSLACLVEG